MKNIYLENQELEAKLLKTKPKFLHHKKLEMVFEELQRNRKFNIENSQSFENESLKINFKAKKTKSIINSILSYFY